MSSGSGDGSLMSRASSAEKTGNEKVWERDELLVKVEEDKTVMYRWWRAKKRFIDVDSNVAVHLVRNALGGVRIEI